MKNYEDLNFQATCFHESAHVVAAHSLNGTVYQAIVALPGYKVDGALGQAGAYCEDPIDNAVVLLAGEIGACFCLGVDYTGTDPRQTPAEPRGRPVIGKGSLIVKSETPFPVYPDDETFFRCMQHGGRGDQQRAWQVCRKACRKNDEQAYELYQALERRAMGLVAEKLFQIKMLADVLERKLTLGAAAITALLGRAAT